MDKEQSFAKIRDQYYDLIINNATEGIMITQDGKLKYSDPQIKNYLGYTTDELLNTPFLDFIHPDDRDMVWENNLKRLSGSKEVGKYLFRAISASGDLIWLETTGLLIEWEDRPATLNFISEVTEKVKSEALLKKSEEKYKGIVNSSPNGILVLDTKGVIIDFNDAFLKLSGYSKDDFFQKTLQEIPGLGDSERELSMKVFEDGITGKQTDPEPFELEITNKNGNKRWLEIKARLIKSEKELIGALATCQDITEKKNNLVKIAASERKYRELHEKMLEATIVVDLDGRIIEYNNAFRKLTQYSEDELSGKELGYIIHKNWKKEEEKIRNNQVLKKGFSEPYEIEIKKSNNTIVPVEVFCYLRENQDNEPEGFWYFLKNIQTRKQFENELIEREIQLKTVLEYSPIPLIQEDLSYLKKYLTQLQKDGINDLREYYARNPDELDKCYEKVKITFCNQEALHFFGVSELQEIEESHLHLQSKDLQYLKLHSILEFISGRTVVEQEAVFEVKSGFKKDVLLKSVILPGNEKTWKTVLVSIIDLSERIQSDKQIRVLSEAITHSPVSVVITDIDGKIEYVNPKFTEVTGYTPENVIGQTPSFLKSGNTPNETYKDLWNTIIKGGEWIGEIQNKKKNGKLFWELSSISAVKNARGEVTHFVAIKEDITVRKESEAELIDAKRKAEEADRLKTAFLANMSHEIRTPMNAIVGFSELLRTTEINGPEKEEYFNIINNSCNTLSNLIDDIIDLAKIEAGQTKITYDVCKPFKVMKELQVYFEEEVRKSGKPMKIVMEPSITPELIIKTDEFRLRQILSNLIGNAVKFTLKGLIAWGCSIKKDKYIEFFIKDTGIGISSENLESVFDRFRQMDGSSVRKYGGTGLGLPVSKSLVELMGGRIWVDSKVGRGSEFYFTIPYELAFEEISVFEKNDRERKEVFQWKDKNILIVEDNYSNYEFIKAVLSKTKAGILWADTGPKAIEIFRKEKNIHMVLMDIQIPEIDGYEATRIIKKINPDIPVIAQTAYAMSQDREKSLSAGCDDYISKPIKPLALLNLIEKYF